MTSSHFLLLSLCVYFVCSQVDGSESECGDGFKLARVTAKMALGEPPVAPVGRNVASAKECAEKCLAIKDDKCQSFQWYPQGLLCRLDAKREPTQSWKFCQRANGSGSECGDGFKLALGTVGEQPLAGSSRNVASAKECAKKCLAIKDDKCQSFRWYVNYGAYSNYCHLNAKREPTQSWKFCQRVNGSDCNSIKSEEVDCNQISTDRFSLKIKDQAYTCDKQQAEKKDGWIIGGHLENCNESCLKHGLVCTEDGLFKHNNEVDSSDKVMALIKQLGGSIQTDTCSDLPWIKNKVITPTFAWNGYWCAISAGKNTIKDVDCKTKAYKTSARLCYCHEGNHGWKISGHKENCNDACAKHGLVCTEKALFEHNVEVESSYQVLALIKRLGGKSNANTCQQEEWTSKAKDVPSFDWNGNYCYAPGKKTSIDDVDCGRRSGDRRLCYCHQ